MTEPLRHSFGELKLCSVVAFCLYISGFGVTLKYVSEIYYNGMDFIAIFAPIFVGGLCNIMCAVFVNQ